MSLLVKAHELLDRLQGLVGRFAFLPPLVTRLVVGYGFYLTGSGKLRHLDNLVRFFNELGIPYAEIQAPMVATLEYVGGICLLAGVLTRFMAFNLAGTMVVALLTADKASFLASWTRASDQVPTDITSFAYLVLLAWLVMYGAGALSVDALVKKLSARGEACPVQAPRMERAVA